MRMYQLRYLARPLVAETVDAEGPDEAEDLARRRLLFSEPGFAIAILFEGVELNRVTQRSKAAPRAGRSARPTVELDPGLGL